MKLTVTTVVRIERTNGDVTEVHETISDLRGGNPRFEGREAKQLIGVVADAILDRLPSLPEETLPEWKLAPPDNPMRMPDNPVSADFMSLQTAYETGWADACYDHLMQDHYNADHPVGVSKQDPFTTVRDLRQGMILPGPLQGGAGKRARR